MNETIKGGDGHSGRNNRRDGISARVFWVFVCLVAIYCIRLSLFPENDSVLQKFDNSTEHIFMARIVEEPNESGYQSRAKAKIISNCTTGLSSSPPENIPESDCTKLDANTFTQISFAKSDNKSNETTSIEVGDIIKLRGTLKSITFDPDQNSLQNYFKKEQIFYEIKNAKVINIDNPFSIKRKLVRFRKIIEQSIADALPRPHADLAQGLVVSGKGSMSKELLEQFKRVGLIHIVVLSGSNVSIIATALMSSLRLLPKILQVVFGVGGMTLFALMTGASPPVVRSVLMSSIPLIFGVLKNTNQFSGTSLLFLTGYVMCLFNPLFLLYDISFQLSFMATLGLVLYTKPIEKRLTFMPATFGLREIIASSLATQILVAPLLLEISGSLSTVFLGANIMVLPILPIVMFCIFLTSLSSFIIPIIASGAGFVSLILLQWILKVTEFFSSFSFASIHIVELDQRWVLTSYFFIFSITGLMFRASKKRTKNAEILATKLTSNGRNYDSGKGEYQKINTVPT